MLSVILHCTLDEFWAVCARGAGIAVGVHGGIGYCCSKLGCVGVGGGEVVGKPERVVASIFSASG